MSGSHTYGCIFVLLFPALSLLALHSFSHSTDLSNLHHSLVKATPLKKTLPSTLLLIAYICNMLLKMFIKLSNLYPMPSWTYLCLVLTGDFVCFLVDRVCCEWLIGYWKGLEVQANERVGLQHQLLIIA